MSRLWPRVGMLAFLIVVGVTSAAVAQDKLRIASGLAGTWENSVSELGQNAGFFKKYGEIPYTRTPRAAAPAMACSSLMRLRGHSTM